MAGLAEKLGKISPEDVSAAAERVKAEQAAADRDNDKQIELLHLQDQKQIAKIRLGILADLIEKGYSEPLQDMGLVAFSHRREIEPIHLGPQTPETTIPGFSSEGRYMLPMFLRGGDAEKHSLPSLDYSDSFSIELGCDASGGKDHLKISVWLWDGKQKYVRDEAIRCLIPVPDGAITLKLAHERDISALHDPLVKELTKWLEAFAERNALMKNRLTQEITAIPSPAGESSAGEDSPLQQTEN